MSEHDGVPFDIEEPIDVGDLSDQTTADVIDPVKRVRFAVKTASIRSTTDKDSGTWLTRKLAIQAAVSDAGINGEGKYAGKRFFPELVLTMNTTDFPERFDSDWWKKRARGATKEFFVALGYDPKALPRIDDDFLNGLVEREFVADITRREIRQKVDGEYQGTGEYRNELAGFRRVSAEAEGVGA